MKKRRILIADDHAIIRNGLSQILDDTDDLEPAGQAANGTELQQQLRSESWDLLILDLSMPGRNGLDLIKVVKADYPKLPILIFTMHQEEQYAVRAIRAGAAGYVTKESDTEVLLSAARKLLGGGVHVSQRVVELLAESVTVKETTQPHTKLSNREFEVFQRIVAGQSLTDIAEQLSLSIKTVSTHKSRLMQKLGIGNQTELIRYASDHGLVDRRPEDPVPSGRS
mgnify:CR=1 FL=1